MLIACADDNERDPTVLPRKHFVVMRRDRLEIVQQANADFDWGTTLQIPLRIVACHTFSFSASSQGSFSFTKVFRSAPHHLRIALDFYSHTQSGAVRSTSIFAVCQIGVPAELRAFRVWRHKSAVLAKYT